MARGRVRKTSKGQFDENNMRAAVNAFIESKISIRQAALRYSLKFQTVFEYVKKQRQTPDTNIRMSPNYACRQIFSRENENALADYILTCSKMCYGQTIVNIKKLAYEMAIINGLPVPNSWQTNKQAGREWFLGFMTRHPKLSVRQPEACSLSRATSFNRHNVGLFFTNLENIFKKHGNFNSGTRIYNLDETATTTVRKPKKIIAQKGIKQVSSCISAERGLLVTTCCVVSASGNTIPPVMVFPRKKINPRMTSGAPAGTLGLVSDSGWMTRELFPSVMRHFIAHTSSSLDNPSLLIFDNHESHLTIEGLNLAKDNGVVILTLPPHTSNKLQPLDVAVFSSFKAFYNTALQTWLLEHPGIPVTIFDIAGCVSYAFEKSMTPSNIKSGFRKAGIYPFDKYIFTDDDFALSSVTDRILHDNSDDGTSEANDHNEINEPSTSNVSGSLEQRNSDTFQLARLAKKTPDKKMFLSPQEFKGYPKAKERKTMRKNRQKSKSIIATDTPEKMALEEKQKERERKKALRMNKSVKRKVLLEESTDEEDDVAILMASENSDDDIDLIGEIDPLPLLDQLNKEPEVGDFILVLFEDKKKNIYYVGEILCKNEAGEFEVKFLRKSLKYDNSFIFPITEDISLITVEKIKIVLPKPTHVGSTMRQQSYLKFEVNFSNLDVR